MCKRLFFIILIICFAWRGFGQSIDNQTITVGVDAGCHGFVATPKDRFTVADSTYLLSAVTSVGLRFKLSTPPGKDIAIILKGQDEATQLELKKEFFDVNGQLSTDAKMVLHIQGHSMDLKKPFNILVKCAEPSVTILPFSAGIKVMRMPMPSQESTTGNAPPPDDEKGKKAPDEVAYSPGSAVYDALELADTKTLTQENFIKILRFYYGDGIGVLQEGLDAVSTNPFLKTIIVAPAYGSNLVHSLNATQQSAGDIFSNLSWSSIGGLDVTKFADGLAKFLVKRTKEELNIAFFTKFKAIIDQHPEIKAVFPKTYTLLASIGDEIYNYDQYIQNLREAFKEDIQNLAENLPSIIPLHAGFFREHPALKAALNSGCYLASALQKQVHPGDILANYPLEFLDGDSLGTRNIAGAVQTLQLLSASLRDTTSADSSYWVNIKYVRQLVDNKQAFKIYLGLVYQLAVKNYGKVGFDGTTLVDWLDRAAPDISNGIEIANQYKLYIMRLAEKTDNLNRMIKGYSRPANDSMAIELYKKYFDAFEDYFEYIVQVGKLPLADKSTFLAGLPGQLAPYFSVARSASALVVDINRKNYSSAINNAVAIYNAVRSKPLEEAATAADKQAEATKTLAKNDPARVAAQAAAATAETAFAPVKDTRSSLIKYGSFMAAISTAKTSDEVAAAIEAAALPSGSARIKRESPFSISINAYTGLYVGHESIDGMVDKTPFNTFGVTAPVGAAISWGHQLLFWSTGNHAWSTSLFLSVLDIGALASYRFKNDTTSQVPTIELKSILSPGAFLSIGIPKSPLSVNFGAQLGPNLRKINFNSDVPSDDSNNKIYWRYSVSFCVDIPIFNLYTRSR